MTTEDFTETDTPDTRTDAQIVRFKLELALMMLACGRDDEAQRAMSEAFETLEIMIALGQ